MKKSSDKSEINCELATSIYCVLNCMFYDKQPKKIILSLHCQNFRHFIAR